MRISLFHSASNMPSTKYKVIDSHVHLFAKQNLKLLKWDEAHPLHSDYRLDEYLKYSTGERFQIEGLVFIETDPIADLSKGLEGCEYPIEEYLYVARNVTGNLNPGEGETSEFKQNFIKAIVPWAPMPLGSDLLSTYVEALKARSLVDEFKLVKGFRYLLQDKPPNTMLQKDFVQSLKWLDDHNFIFDWGIDLRCGGLWQFEETIDLFKQVPNLSYIINHLTKPNLAIHPIETEENDEFLRWKDYMKRIYSSSPNSYMKLSGGFSEFPSEIIKNKEKCVEYIYPWFKICFDLWNVDRTIWASNWPVCSLTGGENLTSNWFEITEMLFDKIKLDEESRKKIYSTNYLKAYNLS